ncbi:hypothetical protein ACFUTY_25455 [Streptomyces sp. NPDC057362]|uniref:hypothetical protein n=1 Tax=Streptomyces sp. NPDC057362 TaxID=3346106 RepID=UPI003639A448
MPSAGRTAAHGGAEEGAGKEGILFRLAEAAVGRPEGAVRAVLYPVVGEKTLRDLVAEAKANEKTFKAKVRTTLRSSYSSYYRPLLPPLLNTLGFKCKQHRLPAGMDALALLVKYADVDGKTRFYEAGNAVPMDGVVRWDWRDAVVDDKGKRVGGAGVQPEGRPARRLRVGPHRAPRRDPPAREPR